MMKKIALLLTALAACGALAAPPPSNRSAEAPFVPANAATGERCGATVAGNQVRYGGRTATFEPNGKITVTQHGKLLLTIFNSFKVKDGPFISTTARNRNVVYTVQPMQIQNKTFVQRGFFELPDKRRIEFVQTTRVLEDGRLALSMAWTVPADAPADLLTDESLFFGVPSEYAYGRDLIVYGEGGSLKKNIPVADAQNVAGDWRASASQLQLPADTPFCFGVLPTRYGRYSVRNYFKQTNLRLFPARGARRVECIVDLRYAPAEKKNVRKYAGLDFQELDHLAAYDRDLTRNMIANPSFEQGSDCAMQVKFGGFDASRAKWEKDAFQLDRTQAKFGGTSLRLAAWAPPESRRGDWRGIFQAGDVSTHPVLLEPGRYVFSCYVKGNRPGQDLSVWVSRSSMAAEEKLSPRGDHYIAAGRVKIPVTGEWTRVVLPFKALIAYPATVNFNVTGKTGDGFVWIDGLQLERGDTPTAFVGRPVESQLVSSARDNVIEYGTAADLKLHIRSGAPGGARIEIRNFFGDTVFRKDVSFAGNVSVPLDFAPDRGLYVVRTDYTLSGGVRTFDHHRFMVMTTAGNNYPNKNLFAVDYTALSSSPMFLRELARYQRLGYGSKTWFQQNFRDIHDTYKRFGFDISHGYMTDRAPRGGGRFWIYPKSSIRRALDSAEPLIRDYRDERPDGVLTEDYIRRFKEAVRGRVKNHPWVKRWSFHGEDDAYAPNYAGVTAPDREFEQYVRLHLAFRDAVKQVNPELQVVGGQIPCNTSPTGIPALERFLKAAAGKGRYDVFAIHHYRESPEAPDLDFDLTRLRAILTRHGYPAAPVMLTEGGQYGLYVVPQWELWGSQWNTVNEWVYGALGYDIGWYEKQMAARNVRTYLIALKNPHTSFVTLNPVAGRTFAMDINLTPYAVQKAINTLARLLGDAKFVAEIRFAPFTRAYLFEDGRKRPVAAVWNHDLRMDSGVLPYQVAAADFGTSEPEVFDMMETRRANVVRNGKLEFAVSSYPVFLRGPSGAVAQWRKALAGAELVGNSAYAPVELAVTPSSPEAMCLEVVNLLSRPYQGELDIGGRKISMKLAPSEKRRFRLPLPVPLVANRMTAEQLSVRLGSEALAPRFEGMLCRRISGEKPDWNTVPPVPFTRRIGTSTGRQFSGSYQLAWNKENLFVRVQVRDGCFMHQEYVRSDARWNNDSLQIYFDTLLNARLKKQTGYDQDDYEYGIFPNAAGTGARVWRARQPDMQLTLGTATPRSNVFADDIPAKFTRTSDGYIYEAAFPAKYLLPIRLERGSAFGFGMLLNNRDRAPGVNTSLTLATDGKGCYNRPHAWPVLLLWE